MHGTYVWGGGRTRSIVAVVQAELQIQGGINDSPAKAQIIDLESFHRLPDAPSDYDKLMRYR